MRIAKLMSAAALVFVPLSSCAEEGGTERGSEKIEASTAAVHDSELRAELLGGGEILSIGKDESGGVKASYFFTSPPTAEELSSRIIAVMEGVEINKEFIHKISARLPKSRVLKKERFSLPLTDMDGMVYRFDFLSDIENRFYVINYISE